MFPLYQDTGVCLDDYKFTRREGQEGFSEALLCVCARPQLEAVSYMRECPAQIVEDGTVRYELPDQRDVDMLEQVTSSSALKNPRLVFRSWLGDVSVPFSLGEELGIPYAALCIKVEVWADGAQNVPTVHARCAVMRSEERRKVFETSSWRGYSTFDFQLLDKTLT